MKLNVIGLVTFREILSVVFSAVSLRIYKTYLSGKDDIRG
jgi:hypothetical protein